MTIGCQILDFLVIHKAKKGTYLMKMKKLQFFWNKSGLQWPLINKLKRLIYRQTKSDFLDTFLILGSLCLVGWGGGGGCWDFCKLTEKKFLSSAEFSCDGSISAAECRFSAQESR